jgi:hypothetical protein
MLDFIKSQSKKPTPSEVSGEQVISQTLPQRPEEQPGLAPGVLARAQYLQNINIGLMNSVRLLRANVLLNVTEREIFHETVEHVKNELLQVISMLEAQVK